MMTRTASAVLLGEIRHTWFESLELAPTDLLARAHEFFGSVDATDFEPSFDLWGGGGLASTAEGEARFLRDPMTGLVCDPHDDALDP